MGFVSALGAASIWAAWIALTRYSTLEGVSAYDLVALRYGVSGLLLSPFFVARLRTRALPPLRVQLGLSLTYGLPFALCATVGLMFAPASHGAALTPGMTPVAVALIGYLLLRERPHRYRLVGAILLLVGGLSIGGYEVALARPGYRLGHAFFLAGAVLLAAHTILVQRARVDPMIATMCVAVYSAALFLPPYLVVAGPRLFDIPPAALVFHGGVQGVGGGILGIAVYSQAIRLIGAARASTFAALIPVLATGLGAMLFHETPGAIELFGIVTVSIGVFLSNAPPEWVSRVRSGLGFPACEKPSPQTGSRARPPIRALRR